MALIATAAGSAFVWQVRRWHVHRNPVRRKRHSLLKPAQRYAYAILHAAVGDFASIQAGVSLSQVIVTENQSSRRGTTSRIDQPVELDFLLCSPETLEPRMAVLLTGDMEADGKRRSGKGELRLSKQLHRVGLPVLSMEFDREYDLEHLREIVETNFIA